MGVVAMEEIKLIDGRDFRLSWQNGQQSPFANDKAERPRGACGYLLRR